MTTWGLSAAGFKPKAMDAIKKEMESELKSTIDPNLLFGSDSIAGLLTGIIANEARQVWEVLGSLYNSLQPDSAIGKALDALCSLTGTYRKRARLCRAKALMSLDGNISLAKDMRIRTLGGDFFKTATPITNANAARADIEVEVIAEEFGPIAVVADTKAEIMTPSSGWISARIKEISQLGRYEESDEELRSRRIKDLKAHGSSTKEALNARLKQLEGVLAFHVNEQPNGFEVIVSGGKDEDIAHTIWHSKPIGVETIGQNSCPIVDSIDQTRTIRFSRPKVIPLSLHTNIKVREKLDDKELGRLKSLLTTYAEQYFQLGAEIYASRFYGVILENSKVLDILSLQLRDRASGSNAPSKVNIDQIAAISFKDIFIEQIIEVEQ